MKRVTPKAKAVGVCQFCSFIFMKPTGEESRRGNNEGKRERRGGEGEGEVESLSNHRPQDMWQYEPPDIDQLVARNKTVRRLCWLRKTGDASHGTSDPAISHHLLTPEEGTRRRRERGP